MKLLQNSKSSLAILAALLVIAFFLPDVLGGAIGLAASLLIVLLALVIYHRWCRTDRDDQPQPTATPKNHSSTEEQ